jgi:hypothetical protein
MSPELAGQITLLGLQIINRIIDDIPKERRVQMWEDWFKFIDQLKGK